MARLQNSARVLAFLVYAGESRWTIAVFATLRFWFLPAAHVRISEETNRTPAQRYMILHPALRQRRARVVVNARVDALGVNTLPVTRTIAVRHAPNQDTPSEWIAPVAAAASALRLACVYETLSVDSAGVLNQTGADAVAVDARLGRTAFGIGPAPNRVTGGVRVPFEALFAGADRAVVLHETFAVKSAVAGVATESVDAGLAGRAVVV